MTPIREIDISEPLEPIESLAGHTRCMVVVRWRRSVVGRAFLPVIEGRIPIEVLEPVIAGPAGQEAVSRWLDETLQDAAPREPLPLCATAAICTRERPEDLARALRAISPLLAAGHEVMVVDNSPVSPSTRRVVDRFPGVHYVCEPKRGLNAARNRALREARGQILAFTDDDAVPEPEWLDGLLRNFAERRIACATGLTLPLELETTAQELFEAHCTFVRGFSRRLFDGTSSSPLAVGPIGAGANMAVRKDVALDLGGFDERLDAGTPTRSGGDHEMFIRLLAAGHQIAYDPAAVSWHRHRRSDEELLDTVYGYGVGVYAMWTGLLLERRELGVLGHAWRWFRRGQLPALLGRSGRGTGAARLVRAELRGCMRGPSAWQASRRLQANEV